MKLTRFTFLDYDHLSFVSFHHISSNPPTDTASNIYATLELKFLTFAKGSKNRANTKRPNNNTIVESWKLCRLYCDFTLATNSNDVRRDKGDSPSHVPVNGRFVGTRPQQQVAENPSCMLNGEGDDVAGI